MPLYQLHILNWEMEGEYPEDAVRRAIKHLKEIGGPEDFVWTVTREDVSLRDWDGNTLSYEKEIYTSDPGWED